MLHVSHEGGDKKTLKQTKKLSLQKKSGWCHTHQQSLSVIKMYEWVFDSLSREGGVVPSGVVGVVGVGVVDVVAMSISGWLCRKIKSTYGMLFIVKRCPVCPVIYIKIQQCSLSWKLTLKQRDGQEFGRDWRMSTYFSGSTSHFHKMVH